MTDMFFAELFKWYVIVGAISFVALYVMYIAIMLLKPYKNTMPRCILYPAYILFGIGFIGDVLWNIIYGTVIFWQKPDFVGANTDFKGVPLPTLTERLRDIIRGNSSSQIGSFRWVMAKSICEKLLNPWDEGHCG